ncbi:uncharacterized protein LOC142350601 isoform X2 [Convolutriloba macropyga]|uniref:uncharacterized protein LOC142350601 isoform X2 n=1 Tax=Convolutriloba macropyga TaxID=536237 RepID=UPI003F51E6FE
MKMTMVEQNSEKLLLSTMVLFTVISRSWSTEIEYNPGGTSAANIPDVESLVFWVSNGIEIFGQSCRKHSMYYCLESYRTPSIEYEDDIVSIFGGLDATATMAWFNVLIRDKWQIINMVDFEDESSLYSHSLF